MRRQQAFAHAAAALVLAGAGSAHAVVTFDVSFADPGATYGSYYADLQRVVVAAGNDWISRFHLTVDSTLSVQIGFAAIATADGGSATSTYLSTSGGINLFDQGAVAELKSGIDPNGAAPDILFNVGINGYLQNTLWFDPDPVAQSAAVPGNMTDARSVFLHEFGHAFGFNGWRNASNGTLPGNYQSTFDAWSALDPSAPGGPTLVFTGPAAMAEYGAPVPLTFGNWGHIGNSAPRPGSGLIGMDGDLMNGVAFYHGVRYQISDLDLAMMQDMGLTLAPVPEPAAGVLLMLGVVALSAYRRRAQGPASP